ncbi:hypothetical protein HYX19_04660 [Candidatus Woesearchaeota archaeon]|nr:hypothetical protein [Candidatus Woesearchaeota archaeon]
MIKFQKYTFIGVIIGIVVMVVLYSYLGSEGFKKIYPLIMLLVISTFLVVVILFILFANKISYLIEPKEDNSNLIELRMNRALTLVVASYSIGITLISTGATFQTPTPVGLISLISGLFCMFVGITIFIFEYLPRNRRLEIRYMLEEKES